MKGGSADDFRDSFFEECEELLEAMHDGFDQIANGTQDKETIHAVFRAVHSIKGGAGAFGLDDLVAFAHHFETALEKVRAGEIEADYEVLELFKHCGDHLSDLVSSARDDVEVSKETSDGLGEKLNEVIGHDPSEVEELPEFEPQTLDLGMLDLSAPPPPAGYDITFKPHAELYASGNEPMLLFRSLEKLGKVEVTCDTSEVPVLDMLESASCFLSWKLRVETDIDEVSLEEVFEFVEDCCEISITAIEAEEGAEPYTLPTLTQEEDAPFPNPPAEATETAVAAEVPGGESEEPAAEGVPTPSGEAPAAGRRQAAKEAKEAKEKPRGGGATIRVDLERVDKLINLVGELVIKEAMLSQSIACLELPSENDVSTGLESLKQLAGEIQEGVMAIRAQPVKPMFQRMARIVREAASATGKRVHFVTKGEYTEVDKTVIERLVDPLTHMIRNAVDHGLEDAETRTAAGKNVEGTVILSAAHRSGRVVIDISDDGGGINRPRVLEIAKKKGLVAEDADLQTHEIDNLLFMPGFSSKQEVSELSGRGVGLDVARSEIQALGGRVAIQSTAGEGTTFAISLPLTLAVMEGMVIDVAGQTMVVPITAIQETLQPKTVAIHRIGAQGRVLKNRDSLVPIVDLGACFQFRDEPEDLSDHVLLLIETENDRRCALIVDNIQDQRQVVIKSLETNYRRIDGIAAATILGDGRIALIIDPDSIVRDVSIPADPSIQFMR
ncbi:MAG: chemotaxis protein CheA [Rhodobacteraceae bacterium]|nr:chemotaxis protein CheA [Paracoccaceae bacterium]MAY44773.1 chemotaxis protein CheA [Paracoccaceae bacterium]